MEVNALKHGYISYLYHYHKPIKDWTVDPGEITDIQCMDKQIVVTVFLNREEAEQHEFWNPKKERVMVRVADGNGETIAGEYLNVDENAFEFEIGVRHNP